MMDDWVYDENGSRLEMKHMAVDNYLNSDKNGKDYKIAKLFGYIQLLTEQINRNTVEIHKLKAKIAELEGDKNE